MSQTATINDHLMQLFFLGSTSFVLSLSILCLLTSFHLQVYILHRPFSSPSIAEQHPRKCSESRESFGFRLNYSVTGDKSLPRVEYVWSPSKWCGKIKVKKLTMGHLHRVFSRMTGVTYSAQMHVVCWIELCGGKPPFFEEGAEGIVAFNCSQTNGGWDETLHYNRVGHNIATTQQQ